ncbi:MAG: Ger(x)C family spore germination C-terminal domain-containing protein [Eubacteriales bacterium]|nr:Ger(x)C family spore germination C-terminal domain-containing protein [Eubacteriales bacterium]
MKRLLLLLCLVLLLQTGCVPSQELDAFGYAVMLGLDVDETGEKTVSFLFQNIGKENIEAGGAVRVVSVSGESLFDAVERAEAALPFSVNLSRLSCIVASKRAALSGALKDMLLQAPSAISVREYVNILVAEDAAAYLEAAADEVVPSITKLQSAQLDYSENTGLAPSATLAVYRETVSSRIDCAVPFCREADEENALSYALYGSALFTDGVLSGLINPDQTQLLQMATGDFVRGRQSFYGKDAFSLDLRADGKPKVQVTLGEAPAAHIEITLLASSDTPLKEGDLHQAESRMEQELSRLYLYCRLANSDVFNLSQTAAKQFVKAADWESYPWDACYAKMHAAFSVSVRLSEEKKGALS